MNQKKMDWLGPASIGPHFVACTVLGWYFGSEKMDKWFDSAPLWTIVFTLLGIGAGFVNVFKVIANINRKSAERDQDNDKDSSQ